jgi:drug/metabolite transporter (DMT)-like permease
MSMASASLTFIRITAACWVLSLQHAAAAVQAGSIYLQHQSIRHEERAVRDAGSLSLESGFNVRDGDNLSLTLGSTAHGKDKHLSLMTTMALVFNAGADVMRVDMRRSADIPSSNSPIGDAPKAVSSKAYVTFLAAMLFVAGCIIHMFRERGIGTCMAIICNVYALSMMSLLIRNIFINNAFPYAQFVTASHALVTCLVGLVVMYYRGGKSCFPDRRTWCFGIAPVGCATALNLGLANLGLLYTNAHFYEMLGSSGFLVTAAVGVAMGRQFNLELLPPMLAVTVGTVVLSLGEIQFSIIGAGLILSATFCRAAKAQIQSLLMTADTTMMQLDPVELVTWTSSMTFVIMIAWSTITEGANPWLQICSPAVLIAVLIAAANAAVLNIASIFVIKSVGPVAQQCIGQLKGVLCCLGAVAVFSEHISLQQAIGYSIVICGIFWYNQRDMHLKALQSKQVTELIK